MRSDPRIGEVNVNCVCTYVCLYVINRPVDVSACSFTPVARVFDMTAKMATKCSQSSASSSEIDAIAELDNLRSLEENEKGSMHGLVGQVSPMTVGKTGKGYFHALLTDGAQDVEIVSFGKSHQANATFLAVKLNACMPGSCTKKRKVIYFFMNINEQSVL